VYVIENIYYINFVTDFKDQPGYAMAAGMYVQTNAKCARVSKGKYEM
jgi:hypothetical protein